MPRRDDRHPHWARWYNLARWQRLRQHQLRVEPWCRFCEGQGLTVAATEVDHVTRHSGDWNAFWLSPLQSLCADCHNSRKRYIESIGYDPKACGDDGWPTDRRHPANRRARLVNRPRSAPLAK